MWLCIQLHHASFYVTLYLSWIDEYALRITQAYLLEIRKKIQSYIWQNQLDKFHHLGQSVNCPDKLFLALSYFYAPSTHVVCGMHFSMVFRTPLIYTFEVTGQQLSWEDY